MKFAINKHSVVPTGPYQSVINGADYETIYAFGSMFGNAEATLLEPRLGVNLDPKALETYRVG
jgi:hypothetical protein